MIWAALLAGTAAWLALPAGRSVARQRPELESARRWLIEQTPGHRRRVIDANHRRVTCLAADLASEVRSGRHPPEAWRLLWERSPLGVEPADLGPASVAAEVMRSASTGPGCGGLTRVAACWEVAEITGAGLAEALERVADALSAEREIATEIDGQLAGPRATARLLVALPLFALILGRSLGADPTAVLLHTTYGWACLVIGGALLIAGWRWSHAQVRGVSPWSDR